MDDNVLASSFEKAVWEQYVCSPRPPPLVHRVRALPEGGLVGYEIADVRRCRKRALEFSVHELPIFCVLDDIRPRTAPELGDLNFVQARYRHFVHQLGYAGAGWQNRVQTEWLLHTGVISWEDVTHTLTATGRLPANLLQEPLRKMEAAWEGSSLAKLAVNSLIGLLSLDEAKGFKLRSSRDNADAPASSTKHIFNYGDSDSIYDLITVETLVSNTSCRPLHDLALCTEATRVGQMLYAIKQCRAMPYEIKTDSCLFRPLKRRKVPLGDLSFPDLAALRARNEPAEGMHRLDGHTLVAHNPSDERVFRCAPAQESDRMKSDPALPRRESNPPIATQRQWRELSAVDAEGRVLHGESLLVLGIAGTGKTSRAWSNCCGERASE
jgi:hypothetical protein